MARSRRIRRLQRHFLWVVIVGVLAFASAGSAADTANGTAVFNGINGFADQAKQLVGQGVLGDALALTGMDPSDVNGLDLDRVFDEVLGTLPASFKELDPATAPAAVAAELEKLDLEGASASDLKVSTGCPKAGACTGYTPVDVSVAGDIVTINVPLKVERTVTVPVDVPVAMQSGGPVQLTGANLTVPLTLTGTLPFRLDTAKVATEPTKAFFVSGTPAFTASVNTTLGSTGVSMLTKLGFTDVTAKLHTVNTTMSLTATLRDPDSDGIVTFDEYGDLAITDMFQLGRSGTATGTLELDTTLTAASPDFTQTFNDSLGDGFTLPTFNPASLLDFRNVTPEQVISGFGQAAAALTGAQKVGDLEMPFLEGGLSEVISVAQPVFDFVNQQSVVCGTAKQTPPTGVVPDNLKSGDKVYCQAFVIHDPTKYTVGSVDWTVAPGTNAAMTAMDPADEDKTVALAPTKHAEFTMTADGPFDARATYNLAVASGAPAGTVAQSGLVTQRPAATAQQLVLKLASLGGFMTDAQLTAVEAGAKVLSYDAATKALTFRLKKEVDPGAAKLGYDFGDQLEKSSGIIALQAANGVGIEVDTSGVGLDISIGVLLGQLSDIGQGQACADPTVNALANTTECPANPLDRFFVKVNPAAGKPEFYVKNGSVAMNPVPTLSGRLGFLGIDASPTNFSLTKRTGDTSDLLAVNVTTPAAGVKVGADSAVADAIRLRQLLFNLGSFVPKPAVNLKVAAALNVSASVSGQPLGTGTVTVDWPDVMVGLPAVTVDQSFTDNLKGFNTDPNLFGKHTGTSSPAVAPDPNNPSTTPSPAVLATAAGTFPAEAVGKRVDNLTDGSFCTVTSQTATTLTCSTGLGGGLVNQWKADDEYRVQVGDPLDLLWKLLDNLDTIVNGIDGITGAGAGSIYESNLPLVGVSPKELVRQINDLRRASTEMRGGPQPTIACGLANANPPSGDPSALAISGSGTKDIYCQLQSTKEATAVQWQLVAGGTTLTNATDVATVATPAAADASKKTVTATIVGSSSDGGHLRSAEHPAGYAVRAVFTDEDGEHVVDFPEQSVPSTLQHYEQMLESKLGLPATAFAITPTGSGATRRVKLDLNYGICGYAGPTAPAFCTSGARKTPSFSAPLNVDLGGDTGGLVGVGAAADVNVTYAANARLAMSFAPSTNLDPKVEPETGIDVKGRFDANNINLSANLGPFAIQAGTGAKTGGAGILKVGADFSLKNPSTTPVAIGTYVSGMQAQFAEPAGDDEDCGKIDMNTPATPDNAGDDTDVKGVACGRLSLAFKSGSDLDYLSDVAFTTNLPANGDFSVSAHIPDALGDELASKVLSWNTLLNALPELLVRVEEGLRASSGSGPDGGKIPVIGDAMDAGADVVGVINDEVIPLANTIGSTVDAALADCTKVDCENDPPGCDPEGEDPCQENVTPDADPEDAEKFIGDFLWNNLGPASAAKLIRKNYASTDAAVREDVVVTARCGAADCTADDDLLEITDMRVTFNIGHAVGTDVENPPAFDLGFDGVPLRVAGALEASAGWNLLVDLGISLDEGPYLVVADTATPGYTGGSLVRPAELFVGAEAKLAAEPSANAICNSEVTDVASGDATATAISSFTASPNRCLAGKLGFVSVNMRDAADDTDRTKVAIATALDLRKKSAPGATTLTTINLTDLVSGELAPAARLDVDAHVNLRFRTGLSGTESAGFPTVVGTFELKWGFVKQFGGAVDQAGSGLAPLEISFDNLYLDASAFFEEYLKPTLTEVRNIVGPFKPVIDTLNAPLPVVSDLAALVGQPPITLLGLMELISGNNLTVVKSLAAFVGFAVELASNDNFASGLIPLGEIGAAAGAFPLKTGDRKALATNPGPSNAQNMINKASTAYKAGKDLLQKQVTTGTGNNTTAAIRAGNKGLGLTRDNLPGTFGVPGLTFPFMSDASQIFGFVMGQDITLIRYDVGTLRATAGFSYNFGPFMIGPVPVTAGIGGSATLEGRFALGYDTSGLRKVLSGGSGVHLFDGIFIDDLDAAQVDVPEIKLIGEVYARAGVTVFVATAGIEGGIRMTIALNLDDRPEPDGKLRIEEIFNKMSNPICLFDVSGKLEAYLKAFVEINYFVGSKKWDWTILEITLLEFSGACEPPKPVLASQSGGTLTLNMGSETRRNARKVNTGATDEKFVVRPVGGGRYSVEAFGVYQVYGPNAPFEGASVNRVVADGEGGNDTVLLEQGTNETNADPATNQVLFTAVGDIDGGGENDVISGGTAGDDLDGGGGNDKIDGGVGADDINGGAENDQLNGGEGDDTLAGEGGTDRLSGGPGADTMDAGADDDIVSGGPAADPSTPDVDANKTDGADIIIGGLGADSLEGAFGADTIYGDQVNDGTDLRVYGATPPKTAEQVCDHDYVAGGDDIVDGGPAADVLFGGAGNDKVTGGAGSDRVCGNEGHDELDGDDASLEASGGGGDDMDGGADKDVLRARSGRDIVEGAGGRDVLFGGAGADHLQGGDGDDDLMGAVGNDVLDGGAGTNILVGDSATIAGTDGIPAVNLGAMPAGQAARIALVSNVGTAGDGDTGPSCTYNRAAAAGIDDTFADCVTGGSGADVMFGEGGKDRMSGNAEADHMRGGDHADEMDGDAGTDDMYGDAGHDVMRAGDHNDAMRGGEGNDEMLGNGGTDKMRGDADNDTMTGGSTTAVADAGDSMEGDSGADVMLGDNGTVAGSGVTLSDPGGTTGANSGNDIMNGGPDADGMYGGGALDTMDGGQGTDYMEGNGNVDGMTGGLDADTMLGGSTTASADAGDTMQGNGGGDLMLGDNGTVNPGVTLSDPGGNTAANSGNDTMNGGADDDDMYGGGAQDTLSGVAGTDYMEGNGSADTMNAGAGDDDMIGGTSVRNITDKTHDFAGGARGDLMHGDAGVDVMAGDNATIVPGAGTYDMGGAVRTVTLLDVPATGEVTTTDSGAGDQMHGDEDADRMFGQAGNDTMNGNGGRDVATGNADADTINGNEQGDLLIGGTSTQTALQASDASPLTFATALDGIDTISGGGDGDLVFGDNVDTDFDALAPDQTSFAAVSAADTYGNDILTGDASDDVIWGELGGDDINGGAGHDYAVGDLATVEGTQTGAPNKTWPGGASDYDVVAFEPATGGSDTIDGADGNDHAFGGADGDVIEGGLGDDYLEGNASQDRMYGLSSTYDNGTEGEASDLAESTAISFSTPDQDDMIGGSSTEFWPGVASDSGEVEMYGNADHDVMTGDNADITRVADGSDPTAWAADEVLPIARRRTVALRDREKVNGALSAVSAADDMFGNDGSDRMYGEGGADRMKGNANDDYLEGNQGADWVEGNGEEDDVIGGSSFSLAADAKHGDPDAADFLHGGGGADVVAGDNAVISRNATRIPAAAVYLTTDGRFLSVTTDRWVQLLDLSRTPTGNGFYGRDLISSGSGVDVGFGQDGDDWVFGGTDDDYLEGNGGIDRTYGDRLPWDASVPGEPALPLGIASFRSAAAELDGVAAADGQDDLIGGSSIAGHRDGQGNTAISLPDPSKTTMTMTQFNTRFGDYLYGDGNDDFVLGDNGTLTRFSAGYIPVSNAYLTHTAAQNTARIVREAVRFDVAATTTVFGDDFVEGNDGDDAVWTQNGNDEAWGNAGNDELLGELGHDRAYGGTGEDAMVGDRGSIRTTYVTDAMRTSGPFQGYGFDTNGPPFMVYQAFKTHRLDRRVNLYSDVPGSVGAQRPSVSGRGLASSAMANGGNDTLRGGPGHDSIHGAGGDDILNGDTGGDYIFGGHGADALWGGRGSTALSEEGLRQPASATDFDDRWVDYLFGGRGGTATSANGLFTGGADVLDFRPRLNYTDPKKGTTATDPAVWHENVSAYTSRHGVQQEQYRQHHHGIDWIYGGWDRDVMQANAAGQGPNDRDRLVDWAGAYNLYTHCEPDYGGYNDIHTVSPQMLDVWQRLAYASGAGESLANVKTAAASGFDELALVYNADVKHNTGQAYPTTPGNFTQTACGAEATP